MMDSNWLHLFSFILTLACAVVAGACLGGLKQLPVGQLGWQFLSLRLLLSGLVGLDVGMLLLMGRVLGNVLGGSALLVDSLLAGVSGVLTVLCLLCPVSLFPQHADTMVPADHAQRSRLTRCLWELCGSFVLFGGYLVFFLHTVMERLSPTANTVLVALAVATLFELLLRAHQSIKTAYERIEALVDRQYQAELLNFMQVLRSQRHDFNFHMQTIAGMIEAGHYKDCDAYVREMVRHAQRLNDLLPITDPVVGAQINAFQELAATRQIQLQAQALCQLEHLPCTMYEINAVLGNLLQNAVDEVENKPAEERWIRLLILKRNRRYIIKVSNPCSKLPEEYDNIFHMGYSTKQSHEGVGLVTVQKIATKYGGAVYLEHDPGIVHFIVRFPEKLQSQRS